MDVLALPTRVVLVWVKPPAQYEMGAMLIAILLRFDGLLDQFGKVTVVLVSALVACFDMLCISLDAWKR